ncbi:ArdC family protein [Avibacterium paragallinarum]|uniref:ArdC family protein n=1 Tax=Avibacterium paragallinarum TaxID=728 RepID=UPI0021C247D1|nr:ArdC family protein [Avibacterium paragallinarum]
MTALEAGTVLWLKPWDNPEGNLGIPCNAVSGRFYQGINILLLWIAGAENGYRQCKWITARAANKLGRLCA